MIERIETPKMQNFLLLLIALIVPSCSPPNPEEHNFKNRIVEQLASKNHTVELRQITSFPWDKVCILERAYDSTDPPSISEYIKKNKLVDTTKSGSLFPNGIFGESYWTAYIFLEGKNVTRIYRDYDGLSINGITYHVNVEFDETICSSRDQAQIIIDEKYFNNVPATVVVARNKGK